MKRILITGKNSYIGNQVKKYLEEYCEDFLVDLISVRGEEWRDIDFSRYDALFHAAGIAHISTDPKMEETYYKVNRDLTIEVAKKAKASGMKQFIFMSSIIVYGTSVDYVIDEQTVPIPTNFYGKSKLEAEEELKRMKEEHFKVAILRPPMVYGRNSKGNYPKLSKLAKITPVFPKFDNKRSMVHIDNLCEFIKLIILNEEDGLFFPQNEYYVNTSELVKEIAKVNGKKIIFTKIFNPIIKNTNSKIIEKMFGNLVYEKDMSKYKIDYQIRSFEESVKITESEDENDRKK